VPHLLLAADADWVLAELEAALGGPDTTFTICRSGKEVVPTVAARRPDLVITDLQVGTMGGMAVTMALRLEESGERLGRVPVLMLLDRMADLHLARRAGSDGWLVKPLDPIRLRKAVRTVLAGGTYTEGLEPADEPVG
jgi:DNA-binding response OmpR family regulator